MGRFTIVALLALITPKEVRGFGYFAHPSGDEPSYTNGSYCEAHGFDFDAYSPDMLAYGPEEGNYDAAGNLGGYCNYVAYENDGEWAHCCCGDQTYCGWYEEEEEEEEDPTSGTCESSCIGKTCDDWIESDGATCAYMESNYGCDCSGCDCVISPTAAPTTPVPTTPYKYGT